MLHIHLFGFTLPVGAIYSPDHLRMWGNLAGAAGSTFWMAVLLSAILYCLSAINYVRIVNSSGDDSGYLKALHRWGGKPAVALLLSSRVALLLGLSAGVLVTAGFAFNETFVYWFPNFAFAFLVLAVVAIFHLFGYRAAERMQTTSLTIVLGGLVVLVAAGFRQPEQSAVIELGGASETIPTLLSGALLLFVGCDLHMHRYDQMPAGRPMSHSIIGSIVFTTFLMGLWGTVSLMHVSAERLSESFIPFTLAARQIGGQAGRAIMGAVVIAGTGCAVVTLFSAASQLVTAMAGQQLLPRFLMGTKRKNITATIIWTTVVAALMAFGFTGSPSFEVFIRAGFMLWMLHMVVVQLMSARRRHVRTTQTAEVPWHLRFSWTSIPTALLFIAGAGYLWMMDPQRILLTVYLAAVWGGGVLLLLIAQRAQRPKRSTIQKQ